jgi:hypothetical protein
VKRVLDELASALSTSQGSPLPRRIAESVELWHQFGLPITPSLWAVLERQLGCFLPALERQNTGLWSFPRGWKTVWDIAAFLAEHRPGWQPPQGKGVADWQEAQVFVGVRSCLMEALNVSPAEVVRTARLMADLGAE